MSRILYGVTGVGFGHSSRADAISDLIGREHDILFAASNKAFQYLTSIGKDVIRINGFEYSIKDNQISYIRTFWKNVINIPLFLHSFIKLIIISKEFRPDFIITDFEPLIAIVAKISGVPLISIDHQNVISRTKVEYPRGHEKGYALAKMVARHMVNAADCYLVTSFFFPSVKDEKTILLPPLVRRMIKENKCECKDHILVYYHSGNDKLNEILRNIKDYHFIVYGNDIEAVEGNISYRKTSKLNFIKDLSSSKAVINNGGYTLISEALFYRKPILSIPLAGQFEQVLNSFYLERLNYGACLCNEEEGGIRSFIDNLNSYQSTLDTIGWDGDEEFLRAFMDVTSNLKANRRTGRQHVKLIDIKNISNHIRNCVSKVDIMDTG